VVAALDNFLDKRLKRRRRCKTRQSDARYWTRVEGADFLL